MTLSVYGEEDAFSTVRLLPSIVDGSTSGNSATNNDATARAIVSAVAVKARPSRGVRTSRAAATRHRAAAVASTADPTLPVRSWVHTRKVPASSTVTGASRRAISRAR